MCTAEFEYLYHLHDEHLLVLFQLVYLGDEYGSVDIWNWSNWLLLEKVD